MTLYQAVIIICGSIAAAAGVKILVEERLMELYYRDSAFKKYTISQLSSLASRSSRQIALTFWLVLMAFAFFASWFMTWLSQT